MSETADSSAKSDSIPVAEIRDASSRKSDGRPLSRLWLVTAVCFIFALVLAWLQLKPGGPSITIRFGEGNGLQVGDPLRFRGIEVGTVEVVQLDKQLNHVEVIVELASHAAAVARQGSLFWIERPSVSLGGVRGLDTLVSGHYLSVIPGPTEAERAREFEGLDAPPGVSDLSEHGLEIVLEADDRLGLERGSPVTYRGVTVGHVLMVGLATDAATVESLVYIDPAYRSLVRSESRFWSNSGFDFKVGFSGMRLDADTLATIAAGGVAFATPTGGKPVANGHQFELQESADVEWLAWRPRVPLGSALLDDDQPLPKPILATARRHRRFGLGQSVQQSWVVGLDNGVVLGPSNVLAPTKQNTVLDLAGQTYKLAQSNNDDVREITTFRPQDPWPEQLNTWPAARMRPLIASEDLLLLGGTSALMMPVAGARLEQRGDVWQVEESLRLDPKWHGACAVAIKDGFLVGILIHDRPARIISISPEFGSP